MFFPDQLDKPEFPIIPDCQDKHVNLILISDASTEDYTAQLQLLAKVADMFASGQEYPEHLKVAMAVSGSDSQGKPNVTWLFELGKFSKTSDVKEAIIFDSERPKSLMSSFEIAVNFVDVTLNGSETTLDGHCSKETNFAAKFITSETKGDTVHTEEVVSENKNINSTNFNSDKEKITLILAIANVNA